MIPFGLAAFFNATSAAEGGLYDRSMAGGYVSLSEPDNLWAVAQVSGCDFQEYSNREFPSPGTSCSGFTAGDVAFSVVQACLEQANWAVYCGTGGNWLAFTGIKNAVGTTGFISEGKTLWRIQADNSNNSPDPTSTTPDGTTAWLTDDTGGVTQIPYLLVQFQGCIIK